MVGKLGGGVEGKPKPDTDRFFGLARQRLDSDEANILAEDTFHLWMVAQTDKLVPFWGWVVFDRHVGGVEVGVVQTCTTVVGFGFFHGGKVV
jgi:hypothetical protein